MKKCVQFDIVFFEFLETYKVAGTDGKIVRCPQSDAPSFFHQNPKVPKPSQMPPRLEQFFGRRPKND